MGEGSGSGRSSVPTSLPTLHSAPPGRGSSLSPGSLSIFILFIFTFIIINFFSLSIFRQLCH